MCHETDEIDPHIRMEQIIFPHIVTALPLIDEYKKLKE